MPNIINMTPHSITLVNAESEIICEIPASGNTVRLQVTTVADEAIDGIPTSRTVYGVPVGLPEYAEGVFYIVSQLVKAALPHRVDLLVPAEMVRDQSGQIIGCKSLGR